METKCINCDGVGYIKINDIGETFTIAEAKKMKCKLSTEPCPDCEGSGMVNIFEIINKN